jgi:hypothetical protein
VERHEQRYGGRNFERARPVAWPPAKAGTLLLVLRPREETARDERSGVGVLDGLFRRASRAMNRPAVELGQRPDFSVAAACFILAARGGR